MRVRTNTVYRLFDSRHVNDLRLVAAAAFVLTLCMAAIAVATVIAWPTACKDGTVGQSRPFGEHLFDAGRALLDFASQFQLSSA
jgi:hypothetical protein